MDGWLCYFTFVAKSKAEFGAYQTGEKMVVIFAGLALIFAESRGGGKGRRARLKIWWGQAPCGFKSRPRHHEKLRQNRLCCIIQK
jgi:hypothetical protein